MNTPENAKPIRLTNLETAEKRRRIAECRFEISKMRHEITTLEADLKADKENFPR